MDSMSYTTTGGSWTFPYNNPTCWSCQMYLYGPRAQWCTNYMHGTWYYTTYPTTTTTSGTLTFKPHAEGEPEEEKRPEWDDVWMALADNIARRSRCCRAQVGAVIVDSEQNVVAVSYNGPPKGFDTNGSDTDDCSMWCPRSQNVENKDLSPTYDDCVTAHAEANAVARADFSRMQGGTIYISTSPCKSCAKIFANSGIVRVVYRDEAGREYRNSSATRTFIEECGLEVTIYE